MRAHDQIAFGQRLQIGADRDLRDAERLAEFGDGSPTPLVHLLQDGLSPFFQVQLSD